MVLAHLKSVKLFEHARKKSHTDSHTYDNQKKEG